MVGLFVDALACHLQLSGLAVSITLVEAVAREGHAEVVCVTVVLERRLTEVVDKVAEGASSVQGVRGSLLRARHQGRSRRPVALFTCAVLLEEILVQLKLKKLCPGGSTGPLRGTAASLCSLRVVSWGSSFTNLPSAPGGES